MITNIDAIKRAVTPKQVLEARSIKVSNMGRCACPVHGGKDANMSLKEDYAHCFVCNESWDAPGLIMAVEGCSFVEAIEQLADIAKVKPVYAEGEGRERVMEAAKAQRERGAELSHLMALVCAKMRTDLDAFNSLPPSYEHIDVDGRVYQNETLLKWGIGYHDKGAAKAMLAIASREDLLETGLLKEGEHGDYEPAAGRIFIPICDEKGKPVGYGARKLRSDERPNSPKYLNAPEHAAYRKRDVLFGIHQAKRGIRDAAFAVVMEGYFDVITAHEYGVNNAVATCGTALTKEQAQLIRRYTDRVLLCYDGDDAGKKATERSLHNLLAVGLHVESLTLPNGKDPDEFLRLFGIKGWDVEVEANKMDTLIESVKTVFGKGGTYELEVATAYAANLIALMPDASRRTTYTDMVVKAIKCTRRVLADAVKQKVEEMLPKKEQNSSALTPLQEADIAAYGIFEQAQCYYTAMGDGWGEVVSNFTMEPIMLIIDATKSHRLVRFANDKGYSFVRDVNTDYFVELASFKKITEARGNYRFTGSQAAFDRIKAKVYDNTPECYPLHKLGWHNAGFYVWGNGITVGKEFRKVSEFGIVEHEGVKYYLPAFAKFKLNMSDDDSDAYEDERDFIYEEGELPTFFQWTRKFVDVHDQQGMMAMSYWMAALFRDIIYKRFDYFPHLNLFGPKSAGKSFMARSLVFMFGKAKSGFNLAHGTQVGFFRTLSKKTNALTWFDEYSNNVEYKRVEALKAAYDGAGHEKGDRDNEHNVKRTKVKSALVISGQEQPTADPALFTRCISMNFPPFEKTDKREQLGTELRKIEQTHRLGQFTALMMAFRPQVEAEFSHSFDACRADISAALEGRPGITDRLVNNHVIPLAVFKIISGYQEFIFDYAMFRDWVISNIVTQSQAMSVGDEVASWWFMFQYMIDMKLIQQGTDFIVQHVTEVTVFNGQTTEKKTFTETKKILFVRFSKAFPLYSEHHRRQYNKNGLPQPSLEYYLSVSKAFVGKVKAKKFGKTTSFCWAFDADKVGIASDSEEDEPTPF